MAFTIPDEHSPASVENQNLFLLPAAARADNALVVSFVRGALSTIAFRAACHRAATTLLALVTFGPAIVVPSPASSAVVATATSSVLRARTDAIYSVFIAEAAQRFALPVQWIRAVVDVESANEPHAVSSRGALGLMQLMPATWRLVRAQLGLGSNPFDPHDNVMAGAAYLRQMWDRYGMPGALAAYNAGPGRWESYLAGTRPLPAETIAYVASLASRIGTVALPMKSGTHVSRSYQADSGAIFVMLQGAQPSTTQRTNVSDNASGAVGAHAADMPKALFAQDSVSVSSIDSTQANAAVRPTSANSSALFPQPTPYGLHP